MSGLVKLLKKRRLLIFIGVILLIVMIIFAGYYFEWSWEWRVIGIMFVLFFWVTQMLYERLRDAKSSMMIEASIKAQAGNTAHGLRPDKREEIIQLRQQLYQAIDALKNSKLRKGVNGKAALYALPWYMFIGPPGSGKTTAIENSGLEFPYLTGRIRGIGGTRNCDWFFSNSAVLLDTAGRYTTEDEDRPEWYAFLDILKKNRKRKPINGVIIGISIADLLKVTPDEVEEHARLIRSRIDELIERLGVRFPVYLVFTKCDLIKGFVEFFGEYGKSEREQVWGATFTREYMSDPDPATLFTREFQRLYLSLESLRLRRLSAPMKREERHNVYTFPLEFLAAKDNLSLFTGKLFHLNPYQENPLFRGFYFTSGTQEGVPIDRVIQTIAKEIGLPPEAVKSFDPEMETKSYFIRDLFSDIIISDQYISEQTSRMVRQRGILKLASFAAIALVMTLFIIGSVSLHVRFKGDVGNLRTSAQKVERIRWANDSLLDDLFTLDDYRNEILRVESRPLLGAGIYRSAPIETPSRHLYYEKIYPFVSQYLVHEILTDRLNDFVYNREEVYREEAYNYLRAYLLLGDKYDVLQQSDSDKQFLKTTMLSLTDKLLENRFRLTSHGQQGGQVQAVTDLMKNQIAFFIDILSDYDVVPPRPGRIGAFETNAYLVSEVRRRLGTPNISDVYSRIKREAVLKREDVTLQNIILGRDIDLFVSTATVPAMFTQHAWKSYFDDEIKNASRNPDQDDWVIAIDSDKLPPEMRDEKIMEERLREIYFREYSDAWWTFLKNIEVNPFGDISSGSRRLKILGDGRESPIRKIIEAITNETSFGSPLTHALGQTTSRVGLNAPVHPVERDFRAIHALHNDEKGELMSAFSRFDILSSMLEMLVNDPPEKTAEFAAQVIQQRSGDIPDALRAIRGSMTGLDVTVRRNLFEQPVILSWQSVLDRTQQYLNARWRQHVYDNYITILSVHYPFNPASRTEAAVVDVERFFQWSNGIFWNFYNRELQPFVRADTWTPNTWEGMGISMSQTTRTAFHRVSEITNGLGLQTQANIQLTFSVLTDLPSPTGVLDQINLSVDGSEIVYRMGGPRWEDITWPLYQRIAGAYIELHTRREVLRPLRYDGRWGLFRLLDEAEIREDSSTDYIVRWSVPVGIEGRIILNYKLRARSINNPFGKRGFFELSIPQTLN